MKKIFNKIFPIIFFLIPFGVSFFSKNKNIFTALVEATGELFLLIQLIIFCFFSKVKPRLNLSLISILISITSVFIADTIYSARIINLSTQYGLVADYLYTSFALFLSIFLVERLNILNRKFSEWGWVFLAAFIIDGVISYYFLLKPYYAINDPLLWEINGTVYMVITIFIFALIVAFAFRIMDKIAFWFLNLLLLLLTSDITIRYQDAFMDSHVFSWAEPGWSAAFIGLACLVFLSKSNKNLFISKNLILAPFISVRSLLTLAICGANALFLIGILIVNLYSIQTALDVTRILFLLFIFWSIANEFSRWLANDLGRTLDSMFMTKQRLSSSNVTQFKLQPVVINNPIFEISQILQSYNVLVNQINEMIEIVIKMNKDATLAEIASQVSHDIRSPLAALEASTKLMSELPEEKRILIRSSVGRIKDIANSLLQTHRKIQSTESMHLYSPLYGEEKSVQLISCLIEELITEKRMQFRSKIGIEINSVIDENSYGVFSIVIISEFMRVVSNLIDNSVEAIENDGHVIVSLSQQHNFIILTITDNGCGIPPETLSCLGGRGQSFGKASGLGLGLYHARKTIEGWSGFFTISSALKKGTSITIKLPLEKPPLWFVGELKIPSNSRVIIFDDDVSIHQIWANRFQDIDKNNYENIKLIHFSTPEELIKWVNINENYPHEVIYLVDYELIGFDKSGLDVIEELGIKSHSILVTSHYEEMNLRTRCEKLGIRIIPKGMAGFIPIIFGKKQNTDYILIDDDELIRMAWTIAANECGKNISTYSSTEEFNKDMKNYDKKTSIYIDSDLGNSVRGELYAKELYMYGFTEIYLATGHSPEKFDKMPWIKAIVGKDPLFI